MDHFATVFLDDVTLTIPQGALTGKRALDFENDIYYCFEGIPYAKPPIGDLRFKAPEPPEPWTGMYNATLVRPICPQGRNTNYVQKEDCLFLNVYTKMTQPLKPVMVWIHGGGLETGHIFDSSNGPQFLMAEDVVVVYVAYRLSVFGFLNIEDETFFHIPGNAGFKDLVMALEWIKKYIAYFGGNPNQVTIFGQNGGATAVHLLYVSPMAAGLFHRAIAQSGVATSPILTTANNYEQLARTLGCRMFTVSEVASCILNSSAEDILEGLKILKIIQFYKTGETSVFNALTIEDTNKTNCFLPDYPDDLIKRRQFNDVPFLQGINSDEGGSFFNNFPIKPNFIDFELLIPKDIDVTKGSLQSIQLGKRIKEFYYGKRTPSNALIEPFIDYITDVKYLQKAIYYSKLQTQYSKKNNYFYHFNYCTALNARHPLTTSKQLVLNGDELKYIFYDPKNATKYADPYSDEMIGVKRMVKLWTTFAKSEDGDPNPEYEDPLLDVEWLPVEKDTFNYLLIQPDLRADVNPLSRRVRFWETIYNENNQTDIMYEYKNLAFS